MANPQPDTQQLLEYMRRQGAAIPGEAKETVYFFDGDFRTWAQVERRAQLNMAMARVTAQPSVSSR